MLTLFSLLVSGEMLLSSFCDCYIVTVRGAAYSSRPCGVSPRRPLRFTRDVMYPSFGFRRSFSPPFSFMIYGSKLLVHFCDCEVVTSSSLGRTFRKRHGLHRGQVEIKPVGSASELRTQVCDHSLHFEVEWGQLGHGNSARLHQINGSKIATRN